MEFDAEETSYLGSQSSCASIIDIIDTPTATTTTATATTTTTNKPPPLQFNTQPNSKTIARSLSSRKQNIKDHIDGVHAEADKGAAVHVFQYGHELKHQLNSKVKGTHPELRNKFDEHLIDVIRNTHSHLLTDVHHDIMTGIIESRIARQLAAMAMTKKNSKSNNKKKRKSQRKKEKSHNETDLEAYASHMFTVSGVMMRDGLRDRNFVSHKYDANSLYYYDVKFTTGYQTVMILSFIVLTMLVLIEAPATPHLLVSPMITLPIEVICLLVQCVDVVVRAKSLRHPLEETWLVIKGICFSLCMMDWSTQVVCLSVGAPHLGADVRVIRALRAVFFIEHFNVLRNEFTQAVETVRKIIPAIFLVIATVLFFAGLGCAMFPRKELALALGIDTTEGDLYIKDILNACIQLWYLFAGAVNFPDVMLPAFIQNDQWWYVILVILYFISFLMVSVFVLQNILIATVIEMHRDIEIRDIIARYLRKHLAFAAAFEVIYNVQDLEETRKRLKESIQNEQLQELDDAITDTLRLQAKLPIALPEKVQAMKLRSKLERIRDTKLKEQYDKRKEKEQKEHTKTLKRQNMEGTASGGIGLHETPSMETQQRRQSFSQKKLSFQRKKHIAKDVSHTGEVDIESQRLFKSTFLRALQQLGQEVLFRNKPSAPKTKTTNNNGDQEEGELDQSCTDSIEPLRKSFSSMLSNMLKLPGETSGRLNEVWKSIYIEQEDLEANEKQETASTMGSASTGTSGDVDQQENGNGHETKVSSSSHRAYSKQASVKEWITTRKQTVNVNSFMKLPDVLVCKYGRREQIQAKESASAWERFFVGGLRHDLRTVVASMPFSLLCIASVVLSFIIEIFIVSLEDVNHLVYLDAGKTNLGGFVLFNFVDISLSCFFIFEMVIRTLAVGVHGYWSNPWWRVDGVIAVCTFVIVWVRLIVVTTVVDLDGVTILMVISCLRGIRIVKFFAIVPSIKVILVTVSKVARKSSHFFVLLISMYYVFSIIGMHMCRSELNASNQILQPTSWYQATYSPSYTGKNNMTQVSQQEIQAYNKNNNNNYNDMTSNNNVTIQTRPVHGYVQVVHFGNIGNAMFTLFHLTFLNNWHVTAEAVMATVMSRYTSQTGKGIAKAVTFFYFICIFILGWVLVMNVFISKFLEGYVEAKQARDEKQKRRRLTSVLWVVNQDGEKIPKSVPMNPDKQVVLDGLRAVFPTMHIKQGKDGGPSVAGEDHQKDEHAHHHRHQRKGKKYCVICYAADRLHIERTRCDRLQNCLKGGNTMHRCELCLSPVCGLYSCSSRVIAPMLVLEVGHVQKMKKLYGKKTTGV